MTILAGRPRSLGEIFTRIDHARTADEAAGQIEVLILEGVLRAGDQLPGERDLSRRLDVSRPILREALKGLEVRGMVETRHGGGTFVADVVGEVFAPPMVDLIRSHPKATSDYLEFRRSIESIAAEYAATRATDGDRELLSDILAAMKAAHEAADSERESAIDVEFHNTISECAHNIVLLHTLRSCYRLLADGVFYHRAKIYGLPGAREKLLQQHLAIGEAVIAGNPQVAAAAARDHVDFVEQAAKEVERTSDWQRVSMLRLRQRGGNGVAQPSKKAG